MRKKKAISSLSVSPAFPELGESILPKPPVMIILKTALRQKNFRAEQQGKFSKMRAVIKQPGGQKPNRD